jgi:hypothetical protein
MSFAREHLAVTKTEDVFGYIFVRRDFYKIEVICAGSNFDSWVGGKGTHPSSP